MIVGVGVDIVEIERIKSLRLKQGQHFYDLCFTAHEAEYCAKKKNPDESLAARFAAKEAVMKALGTGWGEGVSFTSIELRRTGKDAPEIVLYGQAKVIAQEKGIARIHISVSHCKNYAVAHAVAES